MTTITIGRHSESDIVLSHPSVSRNHAEIVIGHNGGYKLVDTNSKFGTFIRKRGDRDWQKVAAVQFESSDSVRFGRYDIFGRDLLAWVEKARLLVSGDTQLVKAIDSSPVERNPETGEIVNRKKR